MDSIEDMFLKLLVRRMNPSAHSGAFKVLGFYSQTIFSQKNPQTKQVSKCRVSLQQDSQAWASLPRRAGGLCRKTCHHPMPSSVSFSCRLSCMNRSTSSLRLRLAWVRGKLGQPAFTSLLSTSVKVSTRCLQASTLPLWTRH